MKTKTAQELINDFIPEVREKLQKLLNEDNIKDRYYENHEHLFRHGFFWNSTKQGYDYWSYIFVNIEYYLIKPDPLPQVYKVEEGERKYSIDEIEGVITQIISNEPEMETWQFYKRIIENLKSK